MSFSSLLAQEFEQRQARNPAYSVRAFAKQLGVSPASLSLYLRERAPIPLKTAEKLGAQLGISTADVRSAHLGVKVEQSNVTNAKVEKQFLSPDQFKLISDPLHFKILGLAHLDKNSPDPKWIANILNANLKDATEAFERLKKLGLINVTKKSFSQTTKPLLTTQDVPDGAIKNYHRRTLRSADDALDTTMVTEREYSATTIAIDPAKIPEVKAAVRKFREEMTTLMKGHKRSRVYTMAIQLFPVSQSVGE